MTGGNPNPDQEWWGRVRGVFLEAVDRPETEREAFLTDACGGDPALRQEVASLLASDGAAGSFGEVPAADLLGLARPGATQPRLQPGTRLGVYEIAAFLAAGGMGQVYRARHTLLDRYVAIKTVSAPVADPDAYRRLLREARHAAGLKHPNICTIHEVGEANGTPFIVMELVEGRPLSDIIREGPPPLDAALRYGVEVAYALEHAHQHDIIHRDLKSSNVLVDTTGKAVVLDFGLARRLPGPGGSTGGPHLTEPTVTLPGTLAGTLSHMPPEVLRGEAADARSDVWALGVMLFELVTGRLPFQGRTPSETSSAIMEAPPQWPTGRVPLPLRLVVERCLVKEPGGRYQRADQVREALESIRRRQPWSPAWRLLISARRRTLFGVAAAGLGVAGLVATAPLIQFHLTTGAQPITALAFLPLENSTGDPAADYYAAGLTDALVAQIGAAAEVRLIAPASAAALAADGAGPAEIARGLGADAILTGRLRGNDERITLDVRLLDPRHGRVLWSDSFERSRPQVLALQADLVRALAAELRLSVRATAADRLATVRAVNPEAYEAFLKGRFEWNRRTRESLESALLHFGHAVELDPTYAPAHAALADSYNQLGTVFVGTGSPAHFRPRAAAAAIRALQIDPASAEAHAALGYVHHYEWRWDEAESSLRRAIELNPSYPLARIWYANLLMSLGRMEEALEQVLVGRDLDPYSLVINANVGWVLTSAGRAEEAVAHLQRTLDLDPAHVQSRARLVGALMAAGRLEEAREQAERVVALTGGAPHMVATLANVNARLGRTGEARAILDGLLAENDRGYVPPASLAQLYNALGDGERTLYWLTSALEERSNAIAYLASEPFESLAADPRYHALKVRVGLR
jgi:TolB-like protein/Tfp pilus assembly protein PilF/predicted Ser/Thr protein kinase